MSSIREQILAQMLAALTGTLPGAVPVYRSRAAALDRGDLPAVVIKPAEEETLPLGDFMEMSHFNVHIEVIVRGDVWDNIADPIVVAAHGLLIDNTPLAALCLKIRRRSAKWEEHDADQTAGVLTQVYLVLYQTQTDQI
jgi:hypothetical protein